MTVETITEEKTDEEIDLDPVWRVVVLNDPVNLMNYVVMVFQKVLGFEEARAIRHMREVHEKGRSIVWSGGRERAETFAYQLQHWRLQAILERDD